MATEHEPARRKLVARHDLARFEGERLIWISVSPASGWPALAGSSTLYSLSWGWPSLRYPSGFRHPEAYRRNVTARQGGDCGFPARTRTEPRQVGSETFFREPFKVLPSPYVLPSRPTSARIASRW